MSALKFYFHLIISLVLVNYVLTAAIKDQNDTGLYTYEDNVEILTMSNFNQTVFGSDKPWIVEFYSSWCGHCQRFAPHWKAFAAEVKNWKDVIGIGVIDCANEVNNPVCFDMVVTAYPSLRYFHQNYDQVAGNVGDKITSGNTVSEHKKYLIDALIEDQAQGTSLIQPNLQPFVKGNVSEIFQSVPATIKYAILILQSPSDTIGAEIALDLHKLRNDVVIRYAFNNNTQLWNYLGSNQLPAMYAMDRNLTLMYLNSFTLDSDGFGKTIVQYLVSKGIKIPEVIIANMNENMVLVDSNAKNTTESDMVMDKIKQMGDVVLQGDLETAIRYSLRSEVGLKKEITGEQLHALRNYVDVLFKYFPFNYNGKALLQKIKYYIDTTDPVNGGEISRMIKEAEKPTQRIFSSPRQWLACKGSLPHTRGYPCGLWKLFHYLTVNAAIERSSSNPRIILEAMHGYIKNFFGCEDCRNHFVQMAEKRELHKVNSWDESVLWLWAAHNEVNQRLAGDQTEDPMYPKVQFPLKERCGQCYNPDHSWRDDAVLEYLKKVYGKQNIQYLGSNKEILDADQSSKSSRNIYVTRMY